MLDLFHFVFAMIFFYLFGQFLTITLFAIKGKKRTFAMTKFDFVLVTTSLFITAIHLIGKLSWV